MRSWLVPAGVISALAAVAATGALSYPQWLASFSPPAFFSNSQTIRVATVPVNEVGRKFFSALKRQITSERARVQLSLIETPNVWASAQALKEQKVDAAVVRSDDPAAADGRAVFVLRNLYAALLVPASAGIDNVSKLKGKKIGVLTDDAAIDPMAKVILDFYGFEEKYRTPIPGKDISAALQRRQISALMVVGPVGTGVIDDAIEAFRKATKKPPKFVDLTEAKALGERYAVYDEAEISAGAFSGSPPVPSEKVTTISAHVLLVAQSSLANTAAGEMTRLLLATKTRVAATLPEAGQLGVPSTDKDELLPAHPGTVAFLTGEQSNVLDESLNWLLLVSMLTGAVGSLAAWLNRIRNKRKAEEVKGRVRRLHVLQVQAGSIAWDKITAAEKELAAILQWARQKFTGNDLSLEDFQDVEARAGNIAALMEERRAALSLEQEVATARGSPPASPLGETPEADVRRLPNRQPGRLIALSRSTRSPAA
jgi:TRAP transporter TAXI family solute receptor